MTPEQELSQVLSDIRTLHEKGGLEGTDALRMAELITKGKSLRAAVEQRREAGELISFGGQSAGMLSLASQTAGGGSLDGFTPAGNDHFETRDGQLSHVDADGEGLFSEKQLRALRSVEYKQQFRNYLRSARRPGEVGPAVNYRVLNEGSDGQGGFLVPEDVQNRIIARKPTPLSVAGRVTQLTTGRDTVVLPRLPYDTDDLYTSPIRWKWTGEQPASATTHRVTEPGFGTFSIPIFNAMMSMPLTSSVIEDEQFGLMAYVERLFGESVDLGTEVIVLAGTGQGQPAGILANPGGTNQPAILKTGAASSLGSTQAAAIAKLTDISFDLAPQYDMNATWVFNKKSTALTIAKYVDSTGRPMWGSGVDEAGLEMGYKNRPLMGYPVIQSAFMDDIGANKYPIIFGDLGGYYKVNRVGFSIRVLNELYAETDQVLLLGRVRMGGAVAEPWRLRAVQVST